VLRHSSLKQKGIVDLVITVMQDWKKEYSKTVLTQSAWDKKKGGGGGGGGGGGA